LVNPDADNLPSVDSSTSSQIIYNGDWVSIRCAYSCPEKLPMFNHGHMIAYFVSRTVADGLPAGDEKSIYKSVRNLYHCGHIQSMEVGYTDDPMYLRSICIPEMKKDLVYKVYSDEIGLQRI